MTNLNQASKEIAFLGTRCQELRAKIAELEASLTALSKQLAISEQLKHEAREALYKAEASLTAVSQENNLLKEKLACTPETTKAEGASQLLRADIQNPIHVTILSGNVAGVQTGGPVGNGSVICAGRRSGARKSYAGTAPNGSDTA